MKWEIALLKEKIRAEGSVYQAAQLADALESIVDRQAMCIYHRNSFMSAYDEFLPVDSSDSYVMRAVLDEEPDGGVRRMGMHTACAANALGYMQCAHAVVDTMAHVIYHSLSLDSSNTTKLKPYQISMHNVIGKLSDSQYEKLRNCISTWTTMPKYDYLVDLTNQSKHRSLVFTILNADLQPSNDRLHGLKFKSFTKDGRHHDEIYIDEFFESFNDGFFTGVVEIGVEINRLVL